MPKEWYDEALKIKTFTDRIENYSTKPMTTGSYGPSTDDDEPSYKQKHNAVVEKDAKPV